MSDDDSSTTTFFSSSALPSISSEPEPRPSRALSPTEIGVVIGSVAIALLILLALVFVMALRRPHHNQHKYQHPENGSRSVDAVESLQEAPASKPFKDNFYSMFTRAESEPFITETEQRHPFSQPQYLKDAYTRPPTAKHYYENLAAHETHVISLDNVLSPKSVRFEADASNLPSSSKSAIKFAPLSIPEKTLNPSNGERPTKRAISSRSSKSSKLSKYTESGWESDDTASIYSMASAFSSQQTVKTPPVPSVPNPIASPTQSSPPKGTGRRNEEGTIAKTMSLPTLSRPSIRLKGDNGDEIEEDETQIYNVAKLLRSRQSNTPEDAPSRHSSVVSHIERSGSIKPIIFLPTEEDSYRPRYSHLNHLKHLQQKRSSKRSSRVPSSPLSPTHIPRPPSTSPTSHPLAQSS